MAQKVTIDYGQADIAAFKQGALSGHIKFDPDVVDDMVRVYDDLIDGLQKEIKSIEKITNVNNFGGFPSTQQLAEGFGRKADEYATVLKQFVVGATQLQEAYLIAGGKIKDAEAKNAQLIRIAGEGNPAQ
ncbi:hypothetical protein [Nocardia terpenica]|uniref:Uncharacterized protein n=1 Tax=Nocardia terpenica TaxID=455432 RepID=A0A161WP90_9NOCA|nr:hypothetical protein [Nocardia terpenica]KZM74955.1 hypothetical protein AWN90_23375 [Nocardia terpenica]NQE93383.1 hypothetical protein [Nocardia terpenica]